jgi:hypothetical protein
MPNLEKLYQIDQNAENKRTSAAQRQQDRLDSGVLKANEKAEKLTEEKKKVEAAAAKEDIELAVPGYGKARTLSEAKEFRESAASNASAVADLEDVKKLGKDITLLDRTDIGKIQQKLSQAVGKLRISLTGPGAMTEAERKLIRDSIGDPTTLFSTEGIQNAKLDQLIESINESTKRTAEMVIVSPENNQQKTTETQDSESKIPNKPAHGKDLP